MNEVMRTSGSRLQTVAIWAGYVLFFVAAVAVSMVLTFPNRQVKTWVEAQARTAGYPLSIGTMQLRGVGTVRLMDVDVTLPSGKKKGDGAGEGPSRSAPVKLHVDQLDLSVAVLSAMRKEIDARFEVQVGEGQIEGGRVRVKGKSVDLDIERIDGLKLSELGIGSKALAFQDKLAGELDGHLSGKVKVHWGGTFEDFKGKIDLELTDAVLREPTLNIQGGLALADLDMGVLTAVVVIDKLGEIAILKGQSARNKATAISFEGVDIFGRDIELVAEERSHIVIPPGKTGIRQARMQVHFAFALPQPKTGPASADNGAGAHGGAEGEEAQPSKGGDRLKWSDLMKFAGEKLKPFQRSGYVGMTCSGALSRPSCVPSLPQVTVGTRRKARSDARSKKKAAKGQDDEKKAAADKEAAAREEAAKKARDEAAKKAETEAKKGDAPKKAEEEGKKDEDKPEFKTVQERDKPRAERGGEVEGVPEPDEPDHEGGRGLGRERDEEVPRGARRDDPEGGDEREDLQGEEGGAKRPAKAARPEGESEGDEELERDEEAPRLVPRRRPPDEPHGDEE